uniref:NADH dehydrogenase [ubiquinone] iron-sulfur protein 4, mitochondrial n=2 Tax=Schistosoma japonicum TaxID=6182 RepID=Q5DED6_SCHJA|nr:SJCHGC05603 protein [Schistosoma japonicum]CAX69474.1 NADH dehydrogenase [Schistosoma japonicum]
MFVTKFPKGPHVYEILCHPVRWKVSKGIPANMTLEIRKKLFESDDPWFRTRLVDSTEEAKNIMKKSESFSKDDRIMVPSKDDLSLVNGVPEEHQSGRRVRIFVPTKPATQSGNYGTRLWRIEFDNRERWENPLMGWASTGDPLSNTVVEFETSEAAEEFCRRQGWPCYVEQPNLLKMSVKSYGSNFSWNKRTRIGSK